MDKNALSSFTKEELVELIQIKDKNLLALDGVWFQAAEGRQGMDAAMALDAEAWRRFSATEARRIRAFLRLPERCGLEGLEKALPLRFAWQANTCSLERRGDTLYYSVETCRVQEARARKGLPLHPCKPVGQVEHEVFAKTIDERISCRCLFCYPDEGETRGCRWAFTLEETK